MAIALKRTEKRAVEECMRLLAGTIMFKESKTEAWLYFQFEDLINRALGTSVNNSDFAGTYDDGEPIFERWHMARREYLQTIPLPRQPRHTTSSKNTIPEGTGLEEWIKTVLEPKGRLYNILRRLCLKEFNHEYRDISPLEITKEKFLSLEGAGKKSWEYFERLRETIT
ncbi:MAG: hypothetical protein AAF575_00285 [Bacteroidota bacterium]